MWRILVSVITCFGFGASVTHATVVFSNGGHAPERWSGNGHYYQQWVASWNPGDPQGDSYMFSDLVAWVSGLSYAGLPAHLATFTSQAEFNLSGTQYISSEKGLVGAVGNNTATGYTWLYEGSPVVIYGTFYPDTRNFCPPYTRLRVTNAAWDSYSDRIGCLAARQAGAAMRNVRFTVEYEAPPPVPVDQTTWGRIKALYR